MKKIYTFGLKSLVVTLANRQTLKKIGFVAGLLLTFGMTAFSQTDFYVRFDSLKGTNIIKNKLDMPAYWTSNAFGVGGTSPVDFVTAGQVFHVQATGYSVTAPLVISGAGSKLVVGTDTSTANIIFTLSNTAAFAGAIDVAPFSTANKTSTLFINQANTSTITLGTLGAGSTVRYAGNLYGNIQKVIPANYQNLSLQATANSATVVLPATTIGVAGYFTSRLSSVDSSTINFNGGDGQIIPGGTYYNLTISGNKAIPDSLTGGINIAGTFADNTTGAKTIPYTMVMSKTGVVSQVASTINYLGLNPQTAGNASLFNVSLSDGLLLNVTAINTANNTITLAKANGDLKVGQKVNTNTFSTATTKGKPTGNAFSNSIFLDTTLTITAINDTVITFNKPAKLRFFIVHSGLAPVLVDTLYANAFDAATQAITFDSIFPPNSDTLVGLTIKGGGVLPGTTVISTVTGNMVTVSKALVNINNLGAISIGNPSSAQATKTITGTLNLLGTLNAGFGPVVTTGSTVVYDGYANRIGGGTNFAYNNLTVNEINATSATVLSTAFVDGAFTIQSGKVISTSANRYISLNENATFTTPTVDTNYVACPLAKTFNSATPFTYYIGASFANVASARAVTITPKTADVKTYKVSFAAGKTTNSTNIDSTTINSIDILSNYNVGLSGYTAGADTSAQLSFNFVPSTGYTDSNLVLAHYFHSFYTAESLPTKFTGATPISLTTASFDTTFGRYVFGTVGPILVPVKLSAVTATALANKTIKINWSSANELSVGKYIVEGSVDGIKFSAKGTLTAKGSSNYSFVDASPSAGINYYRIKSIDIDGKVGYSAIVSAKQTLAGTISIANPVKNKQLSFVLSSDAANYTLKVTNVLGQSILAKTIAHIGGTSTYSVTLPSSALAGTYFVQLTSGNNQSTKTIVVQ